jgi:hypothetical protein
MDPFVVTSRRISREGSGQPDVGEKRVAASRLLTFLAANSSFHLVRETPAGIEKSEVAGTW